MVFRLLALLNILFVTQAFAEMKVEVKYDKKTYEAVVTEVTSLDQKNELLDFYETLANPVVIIKKKPAKQFISAKGDFRYRCQNLASETQKKVVCEFKVLRKKSPEYELAWGHKFSAIKLYQKLANKVFLKSVKDTDHYLFQSNYGFHARFYPLSVSFNFEQE